MKGESNGYNYFKETKKVKQWKDREQQLLRKLNVSEYKITALRKYDELAFNDERCFKRNENVTDENISRFKLID